MKNKKVKKKGKNKKNLNQKQKIILIFCLLLLFVLLLIVSRNFGDFSNVKLKENKKTIFSISDLVLNDLKYGSTEDEIIDYLGDPDKQNLDTKGIYKYKIFKYDGLTLTLKENYDDYILVGADIKNSDYTISRDIAVNSNILNTMKKFKIENSKGTYLYGNYSSASLNQTAITDNIYFGVRNEEKLLYVNRDSIIDGINPYIARLYIYYKHGKITRIVWSYDNE